MVLALAALCLMSSVIIISSDSIAVADTEDDGDMTTVEAYASDFVFSDSENAGYAVKWEISFTSDFSTIEASSTQNTYTYTYPYDTGDFYVREYISTSMDFDEDHTKTADMKITVLGPAPTVTFDFMDGNPSETINVPYVVGDGGTITVPTPTRDGYVFKGWYYDSGCIQAYDPAADITSDMTLYASWEYTEISEPSDSANQLEKIVIIALVIVIFLLLLLLVIFRKRKQGSRET